MRKNVGIIAIMSTLSLIVLILLLLCCLGYLPKKVDKPAEVAYIKGFKIPDWDSIPVPAYELELMKRPVKLKNPIIVPAPPVIALLLVGGIGLYLSTKA